MGLTYGEQTATTNFSTIHTGDQQQQKPASILTGNMSSANMVKPPNLHALLGPLLPALPAAAFSPKPAEAILPALSPILRQRVQLLSTDDSESWIELLCYDKAGAARLREIAQSDRLAPHPVSGEVEVDWDYDAEVRYRRVDEETLQALVALGGEMKLAFRLVYCTGDPIGGDGWRVGEVGAAEKPSPFSSFGGVSTVAEAERQFAEKKELTQLSATLAPPSNRHLALQDEEDDDDDYWARYDATPSRTPAIKRSPAPQSTTTKSYGSGAAEDDYYAQYDSVQPAMDNYDPDEEADQGEVPAHPPPLGLARPNENSNGEAAATGEQRPQQPQPSETQSTWTTLVEPTPQPARRMSDHENNPDLVHPRPASSASSSRASVERLEAAAGRRDQAEFGVRQHVSRSVRSLYSLARASGIDRREFERLVRTELDVLGLVEGEDDDE
ncbi:hypothetical protein DL766_002809 [Monosporascus sp. MC13-8B]|uniref:Uncharacterized protein n=1 Tax=Monosporascus cannonballus TaxID=155416 RepID=A0ABY0H339_9PEZI|nr:hypothetical protein DL762_007153 [Monosporascus cannonballus]RYO88174.1 hypothetical protein DL763_006079 [Monosporascus cannonballus]RYP34819.1 hypothetical protein DL766_002809 [Monosporascus sp. MC13-8B]